MLNVLRLSSRQHSHRRFRAKLMATPYGPLNPLRRLGQVAARRIGPKRTCKVWSFPKPVPTTVWLYYASDQSRTAKGQLHSFTLTCPSTCHACTVGLIEHAVSSAYHDVGTVPTYAEATRTD